MIPPDSPMILDQFEIINESFFAESVEPVDYDRLLADAWRHFGEYFFRYNLGVYESEIRPVLPLRIRVNDFRPSKSQRRVLKRNTDIEAAIKPIEITAETQDLFERHKRRFKTSVPESIYDFISFEPAYKPTNAFEISIRFEGKLIAASFFGVGETSVSSTYGIFDPEHGRRSLGIFTLLKEIEFARENRKPFVYHGYAYVGESYYDYKKRFNSIDVFDWKGNWDAMQ